MCWRITNVEEEYPRFIVEAVSEEQAHWLVAGSYTATLPRTAERRCPSLMHCGRQFQNRSGFRTVQKQVPNMTLCSSLNARIQRAPLHRLPRIMHHAYSTSLPFHFLPSRVF